MAISKNKSRIMITLDNEVVNSILKYANSERRSQSQMAAILIQQGLEVYNKKNTRGNLNAIK